MNRIKPNEINKIETDFVSNGFDIKHYETKKNSNIIYLEVFGDNTSLDLVKSIAHSYVFKTFKRIGYVKFIPIAPGDSEKVRSEYYFQYEFLKEENPIISIVGQMLFETPIENFKHVTHALGEGSLTIRTKWNLEDIKAYVVITNHKSETNISDRLELLKYVHENVGNYFWCTIDKCEIESGTVVFDFSIKNKQIK